MMNKVAMMVPLSDVMFGCMINGMEEHLFGARGRGIAVCIGAGVLLAAHDFSRTMNSRLDRKYISSKLQN